MLQERDVDGQEVEDEDDEEEQLAAAASSPGGSHVTQCVLGKLPITRDPADCSCTNIPYSGWPACHQRITNSRYRAAWAVP